MEFCPKCSVLLVMKTKKFGCPKCSYTPQGKVEMKVEEKIKKNPRIEVIDEKNSEMYPVTDYDCKKCKNKKAYFWIQQMRSGDEAESKFYKCTKCKNTVRVDD